jgi:hypothetical protein
MERKQKLTFHLLFVKLGKEKEISLTTVKKNIFLFNSYPKENNLKHKANIVYSTKLKTFRSAHKTI